MQFRKTARLFAGAALAGLLCLTACSGTPRIPYTLSQQLAANPQGYKNIRFYADAPADDLIAFRSASLPSGEAYLMMSAGGAGGAFGAGVITGWTKSGNRPSFDLVTGVSAGALIAPFAFAGPAYDDKLTALFTTGIAASLNKRPSILAGLFGDSLYADDELNTLVAEHLTDDLFSRIVARHKGGARLLVVTTNLDARRSVIWDMGAIASSGRPDAKQLFAQIIAASASIPAVFAPQMLPVTDGTSAFAELHVDGSVIRPIHFFPEAFMRAPQWREPERPTIYAIANQIVQPEFGEIKQKAVPIVKQSLGALETANLVGALERGQAFAVQNGLPFRLLYIDTVVPKDPKIYFDPVYMTTLFRIGQQAGAGEQWHRRLPLGHPLSQ